MTVIQVYAPTTNAEEAEQFSDNLQDLLELTPKKKKCVFHHQFSSVQSLSVSDSL